MATAVVGFWHPVLDMDQWTLYDMWQQALQPTPVRRMFVIGEPEWKTDASGQIADITMTAFHNVPEFLRTVDYVVLGAHRFPSDGMASVPRDVSALIATRKPYFICVPTLEPHASLDQHWVYTRLASAVGMWYRDVDTHHAVLKAYPEFHKLPSFVSAGAPADVGTFGRWIDGCLHRALPA